MPRKRAINPDALKPPGRSVVIGEWTEKHTRAFLAVAEPIALRIAMRESRSEGEAGANALAADQQTPAEPAQDGRRSRRDGHADDAH